MCLCGCQVCLRHSEAAIDWRRVDDLPSKSSVTSSGGVTVEPDTAIRRLSVLAHVDARGLCQFVDLVVRRVAEVVLGQASNAARNSSSSCASRRR